MRRLRAAFLVLVLAGATAARADDTGTVVRAPRPAAPGSSSVKGDEASVEAGNQEDPLRIVQTLAGVSRPAQGFADLVVWGSAPSDTRILVDGMEIPALYHFGGYRSLIAPGLVGRLDLTPGGWNVENGRGLGGLVQIEPQQLRPGDVHSSVAANLSDASALLASAPADGLGLALAGRYGYLDRLLGPSLNATASDRFAFPRYWDAQARGTYSIRPGSQVGVLVLASSDSLSRSIDDQDPALARSRTSRRAFVTAGLTYRSDSLGDDASWVLTPFVGRESQALSLDWDSAGASIESNTWRYGLRGAYRAVLDENVVLTTGFDGLASDARLSRTGSLTLPPREGDIFTFGQAPGDDTALDRWSVLTVDVGLYARADISLGPLSLSQGLRLSSIGVSGSQLTPKVASTPSIGYASLDWNPEPRLTAAWAIDRRVTATAAAGLYHQAPEAEDRSAVFGTPQLGPERAVHVLAGASVAASDSLSIDGVGFYKALDDLVVRSSAPDPGLAQAVTQNGQGRVYGLQFQLKQRIWRSLSGWVAYTLSRSERRDVPGGTWRLFDYDQTHVLTVSASQAIGGWRLGARLRFATGFPRTPVVGAYLDDRRDLLQPVFGTPNGTRLPDYLEIDLQVERAFELGRGVELEAYLEALNVTNHANVEEVVYNADYTQRGYLTGLPIFGNVGARLTYR